jgi:hypothetical protein
MKVGQTLAEGTYELAIARRYIRRNVAKISFCYQRELRARPGISGPIEVTFTIRADGKASAAKGTGFDQEVAACAASVIERIEFPAPKDKTATTVTQGFEATIPS